MSRYCLESHEDALVIHKIECPAYDLGTLLGLGCVADLGEFRTVALALEATKRTHPQAVCCPECCKAEVKYLPQISQRHFQLAISVTSN